MQVLCHGQIGVINHEILSGKKNNVKLNKNLYSIKGELFTVKEVKRLNINITSMRLIEIKSSKVFTSFGVRLICKGCDLS